MLSCDSCGKPVRAEGRKRLVMVAEWGAPGDAPAELGTIDQCDTCASRLVAAVGAAVKAAKRSPAPVSDYDAQAQRNSAAPDAGGGRVLANILDGLK